MNIIDYTYAWIGATLTLIFHLLCYSKLSNNKVVNKIMYIIVPLTGIIVVLNTYFNYSYTKLILSLFLIIVSNYLAFSEEKNVLVIKSIGIYIIAIICEIVAAIIVALTPINNLIDFDMDVSMKVLFSFIVMIMCYGICSIKIISILINKVVNKLSNRTSDIIYLIITLIFVVFLAYKFIISFNPRAYYLNLVILICFVVLMCITVYNYIKTQKISEKQETLLNFMSKYEKMIDDGRVNRHEMLNNLLILRSFKDKNSKEYLELIDDLIRTYDKQGDSTRNIYNLPSGLKGVLYYKINDMKQLGIVVNLKIDKKTSLFLKKYNTKDYNNLCRVIAILLDNARDASSNSNDKQIIIEFYVESNQLIVKIENTFRGKVNINKISQMNYSTKGKGRGLGLYIARKIISSNNYMNLSQNIYENRIFSSVLVVNKKQN